jgi:hypothetical protein
VILGLTVLYSGYKVMNLDLFPWLNVLISSILSFIVFLISYFIKGKSKVVQLLLFTFFVVQLFLNNLILQNPYILKTSWRGLFYPISVFVFILCFAALDKKKNKPILLGFLLASFLCFIASILSNNQLLITFHLLFFIIYSIGMVVTKNIQKQKTIE